MEEEFEELLDRLDISERGKLSNDRYVITLVDSDDYGRIFSKLDKSNILDIIEENQVVTEQGSSLMYGDDEEKFLLNLIADFDSDQYQLVLDKIN